MCEAIANPKGKIRKRREYYLLRTLPAAKIVRTKLLVVARVPECGEIGSLVRDGTSESL